MKTLILIAFALMVSSPCKAMSIWIFEGACEKSITTILDREDNAVSSEPITCDTLMASLFKNGRLIIHFTSKQDDKQTALGFSGSGFDRTTDPKLTWALMDSLYRRRPVGRTQEETYRQSSSPDAVQRNAKGICSFDNHIIEKSVEISCSLYLGVNAGTLRHKISFKATKGSVQSFPDP